MEAREEEGILLPPPGLTLVEQAIYILQVSLKAIFDKSYQDHLFSLAKGNSLQLRGRIRHSTHEPGKRD